jgi:predicted outer membrane repeat protein
MMTHLLRKQITTALLALCAAAIAASGKTITVTNNNDSGPGSLRAAVTEANGNGEPDTIVFDGGFFSTPRTITLTSGELQVTRDGSPGFETGRLLTIRGPGANLLTISGNNSSRVFYVSNFGNVALSGVTVAGGNGIGTVLNEEGNSGGGLLAHSSFVSLSDVTFRNNAAPNAGGAIYFSSMRNIALANTLITENTAAFGGGIYDVGDTPATTQRVYTDVTISNNTARNREGGASMSAGTTTMTNCRITGNKARSAQPAAGAAGNAGMLLSGGVATITDTVISGNVAGAVPSAEFPNGVYGVNGGLNINATLVF